MNIDNNKGFTLLSTLIAIAILAVISVTVMLGLTTAITANVISDEQTTAETIARSQIEYIQLQPYDSTDNPPVYSLISDIPDGYNIITPMVVRLDPLNNGINNDDGLQEISISVQHGEKIVLTLVGYKVNK